MKTLAVIMPRYAQNSTVSELTNKCIQAVLDNQDDRFQTTLTVVDDGSAIPFKRRNDVKLIEHGRNRGIAVGWNTGWQANPDADFYCWINADCEVTPGWSFPLLASCEAFNVIAMPYTNNEKPYGHGITGWCFMASKAVANTIGPFDETFVPAQYEDTDWFHRAIYYHHIPLVNVPSSQVRHQSKQGGTGDVPRFNYLHMAARYRYAWKHGTNPEESPPFWKGAPLPDIEIEG